MKARPEERARKTDGMGETRALAEAVHAIASAEDLSEIVPLVLERATSLLECDAAALIGVTQDGLEFVIWGVREGGREIEALRGCRFGRAGTLLDRALRDERAIALDPGEVVLFDPMLEALRTDVEVRNGLLAPLRTAGLDRGGLIALNAATGFGPERQLLASALADQAAVAVRRAELSQFRAEQYRRLRTLNAVLQVTSAAFDEETLLRRAVDALVRAFPGERVELVAESADGNHGRYGGGDADSPALPDLRRLTSLHTRAVETGAAVRYQRAASDVHAVCVPLQARDRALGSLLVLRRSEAYPTDEVELIESVGRHLGVALEHARLFQRAATEAERLERAVAERTAALQDTQAQLARSRWLTALGQLAAGVAHDLNNALNPIVAFAGLIRVHAEESEKVRGYADRILLAAQDGADTVRRIRRFTRRQRGKAELETIQLSAIAAEALELTRPSWSERAGGAVQVEQQVDESLTVRGSPSELREALLNLIGNALDSMDGGGVLRVIGRRERGEAVLAIQDNGSGMEPEVLGHVLEPFFTTKGVRGTGLGLPEVYGIVRRHSGELEIESWPGLGTTVTLRLPHAGSHDVATRAPTSGRRRITPTRILIVDDNVLSAEATAASLRNAGHDATTAASAEDAIEIFASGDFPVVLTDLGLPGQSGWDLVETLRQRRPGVRIGVITGWSLDVDDDELARRGIELVFTKPVDVDSLIAAIG